MAEVTKFAKSINLDVDKLLGDWIVCIPGFTLQKYRQLQRSKLSIFSRDCFGTYLIHNLGLPFRSPFVNCFMSEKDFIKFLRYPRIYLEEEPIFEKFVHPTKDNPNGYPLLSLGDILLNMKHYSEVEDALEKWDLRKKRINWYNLFVVMRTENQEILEQFNELPYGKKFCIVPFKSKLDSALYINTNLRSSEPFWRITHLFALGDPYYDVFDMLLYGKKTQLIDM